MTACWEKMYLMKSGQRGPQKGVGESEVCRKEAPVLEGRE